MSFKNILMLLFKAESLLLVLTAAIIKSRKYYNKLIKITLDCLKKDFAFTGFRLSSRDKHARNV